MSEAAWLNLREQLQILPQNLASHLMISVIALAAGVAISVPLGVVIAQRASLRYPALLIISIVQTIPSLALLALMVPLFVAVGTLTAAWFDVRLSALGFWPTIIALTLYSMLPIVRNTVTGILGVDPPVVEAARGVGMTAGQSLRLVLLPLATPVILAGIRTATVWVVGIATLSTPIGQRSLGNFIFRGLQTRNWTMVLVGCLSAAALAVALDLMIGGLERAAAQRRRGLAFLCGGLLAVTFIGGLAAPRLVRAWQAPATAPEAALDGATDQPASPAHARTIRIGAKTFTEQYILSRLVAETLQAAGFPTRRLDSLGSTIIFDALAAGDLDVAIDYSGTIWANHMQRTGSGDRREVLEEVTWWLAAKHGIRSLGSLGFENSYALAMRRDRAEQLGIRTIGDLAVAPAPGLAPTLRIGGDYEFFGRPEWRALRDAYGLRFADQVSLDATFMYQAVAADDVQVISAFSSDGRIAAFDLVTLEDPRQVIPPYDAILLLGPAAADDPAVVAALRPLVAAIDIDMMRRANGMVDAGSDRKTVAQAAKWLREQVAARGLAADPPPQ